MMTGMLRSWVLSAGMSLPVPCFVSPDWFLSYCTPQKNESESSTSIHDGYPKHFHLWRREAKKRRKTDLSMTHSRLSSRVESVPKLRMSWYVLCVLQVIVSHPGYFFIDRVLVFQTSKTTFTYGFLFQRSKLGKFTYWILAQTGHTPYT